MSSVLWSERHKIKYNEEGKLAINLGWIMSLVSKAESFLDLDQTVIIIYIGNIGWNEGSHPKTS